MSDAPTVSKDEAVAGRWFDGRAPIVRDVMRSRDPRVLVDGPLGTGKSRLLLEKARAFALKYPGCRVLLLRKQRKWMTETVLVTWEQEVVLKGELMPDRIQRASRASYRFRNGSEVVVAGLDDPQSVFSSQFDLILIFEATEVSQPTVESVDGRLRNNKAPYQQLLMDCNPSSPNHWLHVKFTTGWCRRLPMRHTDNPALFARNPDGGLKLGADGEPVPTRYGRDYLARLATGLSGVRALRLLKGLWVQAEGVVYEGFDPALHVKRRADFPGWQARDQLWAVDFGFNDPFVWQQWTRWDDDTWVLTREIHLPGLLVEDAAKLILIAAAADRPPMAVVCDHDREDRATLERHLGRGTVPANKRDVLAGLNAVATRLKPGANGRPRLVVCEDSLENAPNPERLAAGSPVGFVAEIETYQWKPNKDAQGGFAKDEPLDRDNHSMDACRYAVGWMDAFGARGPGAAATAGGPDPSPLADQMAGQRPAEDHQLALSTTDADLALQDWV